jgi:transposase
LGLIPRINAGACTTFEIRLSKTPAEVIRLNAQGWYVEKIVAHVNWTPQTVTEVLHKWEKLGREDLWERPRRGGKAKGKEENLVFLEECLRTESHTYNSQSILDFRF